MKTTQLRILLVLLIIGNTLIECYAQLEDYRFEHLSEQDGLSHNSVWSILQDSEGFMWFGTQNGLNRYNGYEFEVFRYNPNNREHSLRHNLIIDMHEDRNGSLWVVTGGGGFHRVDKRTGKVTRYEIKPLSSFEWNWLTSIYEDKKGNLWVCGFGGLARFDPVKEDFTRYPAPGKPTSGKAPAVFSVAEDSKGRFWAGTTSGLYQFDLAKGVFTPVVIDSSIVLQDFWCNYLFIDKDETLWVGTDIGAPGRTGEGLFYADTRSTSQHFTYFNPNGSISKKIRWNGIFEDDRGYLWVNGSEGLHRINTQTHEVVDFNYDPLETGSLSHENIRIVYQDSEGTYWIGSQNGIDRITPSRKKFYTYQIIPAHPTDIHDENSISALLEDHTGTIWIGNSGSEPHGNPRGGLFRFDIQSKEILPATGAIDTDGLDSHHIVSLFEDQQQQLWIGTASTLHVLDSITGKFRRYDCEISIWHMTQGPTGRIWIGGKTGMAAFDQDQQQFKYYKYDPKDTSGLKSLFVKNLLVDRKGDIWAATGAGIARLDPQSDSFTHYIAGPTVHPRYLNNMSIFTLYEDEDGVIWIGTGMGGLNRFDPNTETFTYFTQREGLSSNTILSIVPDKNGDLWPGTSKGLSQFNRETYTFRNFDANDGLPDTPIGPGLLTSDGKLMFGSLNGLVVFDPDSIQDNTVEPPVYITGFQVMGEERDVPTEFIELPYHESFLSFDFVAINYDAPEKNEYAYQLAGVDKDWVSSGSRRFASYTNLDPGNYTFRVKASNNDGYWNEEGASLQLTILPPWWHTGWAYTLYAMLAIGAMVALRHYELKRFTLRQRATHLAELDSLKSRFFANISHEFRTPLTLILGPVNRLLNQKTDPDAQPYLQTIERNAQRLLQLVNQLLDLAKLDANKLQLEAIKSDVVAFLRVRATAFSSLAEDKQIDYTIALPEEKVGLYFDRDKLEKVINNLLSNAFKFTPLGGSVALKARVVAQAGREWVEIQVKNSGKGIPQEVTPLIFDRFYQVENPEQPGSGIGLALTKELVELHYGSIEVESKEGQGTTFTLLLPIGKAHLKEAEIIQELPLPEETTRVNSDRHPTEFLSYSAEDKSTKPESKVTTEKPLILIVEDHPEVRAFIRDSIGDHYQITEAENGKQGVEVAKETLPDLIISDVMMPQMNGYQLCEQIKSQELTSHIPVMLLTAKADRSSKLSGLELGADDYLAKPFDQEELRLLVRNRIAERQKMREHFSREITLEPTSVKVSSLDEQFLQRVMQTVEEHIADPLFGVEAFSESMGMSRMQLYRKLKALTNQSPNDFMRRIRLQRSADLLSQGAGTIADIAYQVGFQDPSYFTKAFQKQFGKTPSEYIGSTVS